MTDPDPDRKSTRALNTPRVQTSLHWSHAASREYSQLEAAPARRTISALAKRVIRHTLQNIATGALSQAPLISSISISSETVFALELSFVDDAEIQEINASHRGKNKPTDVLSFSQLEGEAMPFFSEEILVGDLVVSIQTAATQARELNHSLEHELAFLLAHGTLHLCGFDHDTSARRRAMWKKQDEIVQSLGFPDS